MTDIIQWVGLGLSLLTSLIIPLIAYFFTSLRSDMRVREERSQEAFRVYAAHIDTKLSDVTKHIDSLVGRLSEHERKLTELQISSAQKEAQYVRQFVGIDDVRELDHKIERIIQYFTAEKRDMEKKLTSCQTDCERRK
jgi:hypothetical protein